MKPTRNKKKKIIMVDDDLSTLNVLSIVLEDMECDTVPINDSRVAMHAISSMRPDVVILDLVMPHVDGVQILEEMKDDKSLKKIPVILLSASNSIEDVAEKYSVYNFFRKPFEIGSFYSSVQKLIAN